ncbi:polysaccharide pyruvyl transferase family protein [Candidatus Gracilibacteria bacterium]|nr:polysaccharide pyruvyl transferase family protein [Candidatus Gracilibacteria bacterium]
MQINKNLKIEGKKILIVGNRSYKNLGDELILLGTIKLLMKEKKDIYVSAFDVNWLKGFLSKFIDISKVTFLTEIPKGIKSGLNYFKKGKLKEWKKYREIDSIIIGGGEIITEENPNSYRYRLVSILPYYFTGAKIYLMGGIQVPKKEINKILFDFLLRKVEKIYARDNECVKELKNYGFKNCEFFMDTALFAYEWSLKHGNVKTLKRYIVVNLNKNAEKFLNEIIEDVKEYVKKGYDIYFVPVSKGINNEYNDIKYFEKIKKVIARESKQSSKIPAAKLGAGMTILDWEEDFEKFLEILKGAEIVFTGRLHLFMIAKFLGVKVKVYPYQKKILKMQKVLKDFNS